MLGPSDRGYQALLLSVALIVVQFGTLGLPLAITYETARGDIPARRLFAPLKRQIGNQVLAATLVHAAATALLIAVTPMPAIPAAVTVTVVPCSVVIELLLGVLQGRQQFGLFNAFRLLQMTTYAGGVVALALAGSNSLALVMVVWSSSLVATLVLLAYGTFKPSGSEVAHQGPLPSYREMRAFGLRGMLGSVSPISTMRADQLVVGLVLSSRSLGLYSAALSYANFPRIVSQAIGQVAYPRVASVPRGSSAQRVAILRYTALAVGLTAAIGIGIAALAKPLIEITFGTEFTDAAGPLRILLLATIPLAGRRVLGDALRGAGHPGASSRVEVASWALLVPAMLGLGGALGVSGVALALVVSYTLTFAALVVMAIVLTRGDSQAPGSASGSDLRALGGGRTRKTRGAPARPPSAP
jgi:O-antigen/teichoic acid export membrane protein